MAGLERFEDIKAWQKGRELCKLVYTCTNQSPFSRDYGLREQIRRATVSIVSNIAEGFESQNDRSFAHYLYVARASSGEVRAQAYIALDQGYIAVETFQRIYELSCETSRMITGFINYLSRTPSQRAKEDAPPYIANDSDPDNTLDLQSFEVPTSDSVPPTSDFGLRTSNLS